VSNLHKLLEDYLATRHAMGYKLQHAGRRLLEFIEFLLAQGSSFVTIKLSLEWATKPSETSPQWKSKRLSLVRQFALYAHAFDPRTQIPPPSLIPYSRQRPHPYIYSQADIDKVLNAARSHTDSLIASTHVTLIALIAVTGMRVGEAIRLDRHDIDYDRGILVVRQTKFGKSRELPLHPSTIEALRAYAYFRDRHLPVQHASSFFLSRRGKRLIYQNVHFKFHRFINQAGLANRRPRRPRIHDLRHSFAVRILIDWHRAGVEVQSRLPLLSTYMGHVDPAMTYRYLTAVPELLILVSERAQRTPEVRS